MKLTLDAIGEHLEILGIANRCVLQEDATIRYQYQLPLLYERNCKLETDCLYIARASDLPENPHLGLRPALVSIGEPPGAFSRTRCSVLILDASWDILDIFAQITGVFRLFGEWEDEILRVLLRNWSVQALLELTYPLVQKPLWVIDKEMRVRGHVERNSSGEWDRANIGDEYEMPASYLPLDISPDFENRQEREPYIEKSVIGDVARDSLIQNIFVNEKYAGVLTIVAEQGAVRITDDLIIRYLSAIIASALVMAEEIQAQSAAEMHMLLHNLLDGVAVDEQAINRCTDRIDMKPEDRYVCVMLRPRYTTLPLPARYLCSQIQRMVLGSVCFEYQSSLVAFVNLRIFGGAASEILDNLSALTRPAKLLAGLSNTCNLANARVAYLQSDAALNAGRHDSGAKEAFYFRDYALQHILEHGTSVLPATAVCAEGVLQLLEMDNESDVDYCKTLRVYYMNKMNAVQSAKELHIHRSTFLYRLDRIKAIVDMDLDDYATQLYIMMSLELCRDRSVRD